MAEALFAGIIGFLIGRGVEPKDATSVIETLRTYLGFEPPLGLTGYALDDITAGKEANAAVVIRGKSYDVVALGDIIKHSQVSVLGRKGERLEVAPTIESLAVINEVLKAKLLCDWAAIEGTDIDVDGLANCPSGVTTTVVQYQVPAGHLLLIYDWCGRIWGSDVGLVCLLRNASDIIALGRSGGIRGFQVPFSKPKRVPAGKWVQIQATQDSGVDRDIACSFGGILIESK